MTINTQSRTVWKYKLAEEFVAVRSALSAKEFASKLDRPLRDWTVLDDRPLPVSFFDTSIRTLINSSFTVLFETPGVGQKKMAVLLRVLRRIAGITEPRPMESNSGSQTSVRGASQICSRVTGEVHAELSARFKRVRNELLASGRKDVLARRMRFWAMPSDRRLPTALLDHSVAELLEMPVAAMCDAPYVGPKKISALIDLLERAEQATNSQPTGGQNSLNDMPGTASPAATDASRDLVLALTDATWREWCAIVLENGLADEPLGRFARSLGDLARVLWDVPLRRFAGLTLAELKTLDGRSPHRVRQVLGVFQGLQTLLTALGPRPEHLEARILPRLAMRLSGWSALVCDARIPITAAEFDRELVTPLLSQLHIDLGDRAGRLSDWQSRFFAALETDDAQLPELQTSLQTKQQFLLHEAQAVVSIRWPDGLSWMLRLRESAERAQASPATIRAMDAIIDLFFETPLTEFFDLSHPTLRQNLLPRRWLAAGYRGPAIPAAGDRAATARWHHTRTVEDNRAAPRRKQ